MEGVRRTKGMAQGDSSKWFRGIIQIFRNSYVVKGKSKSYIQHGELIKIQGGEFREKQHNQHKSFDKRFVLLAIGKEQRGEIGPSDFLCRTPCMNFV